MKTAARVFLISIGCLLLALMFLALYFPAAAPDSWLNPMLWPAWTRFLFGVILLAFFASEIFQIASDTFKKLSK
jgi:hypothetical protein